MIYKIAIVYLFVINVITFLIYGIDKQKAKKDKWRVPKRVLFLFSFLGGSIGALSGMKVFRHKTQKWKFKIGIPFILILQIVLSFYFMYVFMNK